MELKKFVHVHLVGIASLALLIGFLVLPWRFVFGQNTFTKIGTVKGNVTSFTDTTCALGATCQYRVTAVNSVSESAPSNTVMAVVPATGTHTVTISWVPGAGAAATDFNVYASGVGAPNPPTGAQAVVN